jgi:hypothetical protein
MSSSFFLEKKGLNWNVKNKCFFKVNPDHDCCYIAYGGEEHRKTDYEAGFDFENITFQREGK